MDNKIIKVSVIGYGNVGERLVEKLSVTQGVELVQVYARSQCDMPEGVALTDDLDKLLPADIFLLAVSDDAISDVSARMPVFEGSVVAHVSGATPLNAISEKHPHRGVVYFFQSFTRGVDLDWKNLPVFVEAQREEDLPLLIRFAGTLSESVQVMDSTQRLAMHLGGCLACNFSNHLMYLAQQWMQSHGIPFDVLREQVLAVVQKAFETGPFTSQSGPARRGDEKTLASHRKLIGQDKRLLEIYDLVSDSIWQTYRKK